MSRYSIIILCLIAVACSDKKIQTRTDQNPESTVKSIDNSDTLLVSIRRTPCLGKCPEYEAMIYTTGYCTYNGRAFAPRQGAYAGNMEPDYLQMIADSALVIGYFEFRQKYDDKITDVPSCYTEVHLNGQSNKVMNRWGAPESLKRYERFIDRCLENVAWKKIGSNNTY